MLLSDLGTDVVRIDRPGAKVGGAHDVIRRGRRSIALDLKTPDGVETALRLIERADALIEGYRPRVMERLGVGPEVALARNPRLVYGRMTGWGQSGPLAQTPGHDINYIALSGLLAAVGLRGSKPVPPLNVAGDFAGGSLYLAFGILAAIFEARGSGRGQVVDCAVLDGASSLMAMFSGLSAAGRWTSERGTNLLDGGAHFYNTYECADGRYIAVGAIEPEFYGELCRLLQIEDPAFQAQHQRRSWPALTQKLTELFRTRTRDEWVHLLERTDACVSPVLDLQEAPEHPHNVARTTTTVIDGVRQPVPAPRFSRTPGAIQRSPAGPDEHRAEILRDWHIE
jgi:alpha-methylacyl-CoA racemase